MNPLLATPVAVEHGITQEASHYIDTSLQVYTWPVPSAVRRIIHVDMDAFYASIEQRDDPSLRGRPVAVGGDPARRGVVAAASYEARAFGVRSALPMARAVRLCPSLVIVRPDFQRYHAVSAQILAIFRAVTPLVEPLSLDEAYLDVTENRWGEPLGAEVARRLKEQIRDVTQLTASAGVAPNKFLAKVASGWRKPDGLTVVPPERVEMFLQRLPIEALWGVGPVTARRLRSAGLSRVVDLRRVSHEHLRQLVGSQGEYLRQLAFGIDDRPVEPGREPKSTSTERTYPSDLVDVAVIRAEIVRMAGENAEWLEQHGLFARTVTLKVRYADFTTVTRSQTRSPATRSASELAARTLGLVDKTEIGGRPVRLLGVEVHGFSPTADTCESCTLRLPFPDE